MNVLRMIFGIVLLLLALFAGGCSLFVLASVASSGGGEYGITGIALITLVVAVLAGWAGWFLVRGARRTD